MLKVTVPNEPPEASNFHSLPTRWIFELADGISVVDQAVKLVLSWPKSKYSPLARLLGEAMPRVAP
jgi:hypothetical protein